MNAVDTNVFVYALDVHEPAKQAKAKALLAGLVSAQPGTSLLWQVAGELLSVLRNWETKGRVSRSKMLNKGTFIDKDECPPFITL